VRRGNEANLTFINTPARIEDQCSKKFRMEIRPVFEVAAQILEQTTKCRHDFSCLRSGQCGDKPMCGVETAHGEDVLCVSAADWLSCPYHQDFGGAKYCVCPVRCAIHQQQTA
jgi:hypothetical protein